MAKSAAAVSREEYEARVRKEILLNAGSFEHFCKHLRITSTEGNVIPFNLNEVQKLLLEIRDDIVKRDLLVRMVILKARREGISTLIEALFFWHTTTKSFRQALTLAHEPEASDTLFGMVKRYYNNMLPELRPSTRYNNKRLLDFNTPDGKGLDSMFKLGTAGKGDYGSSQLNHYLHISEAAKIKPHVAPVLFTSVFQTVSKEKGTEVYVESTAKGAGGEFYSMFQTARYEYEFYLQDGKAAWRFNINENASPENRWIRIFIPWFVDSRYQAPVDSTFEAVGPSSDPALLRQYEDEVALAKLHGLTDEQLQWRRLTIQTECRGSSPEKSLDNFHAEYPSTAQEAFVTSGNSVFDITKLLQLRKDAPACKARYNCIWGTGNLTTDPNGPLQVWEEPQMGETYVIGADISEGLIKGDFSSIDVVNFRTGNQAAHLHGKYDPDVVAYILSDLGKRYNHAWVVPERNNHGHVVITTLVKIIQYRRVYATKGRPGDHMAMNYGWLTTSGNKPAMIDNLVQELRDDEHGINNVDTLDEMLSFVQHKDGRLAAIDDENIFDDRVMSYAIARYVRRFLPLPNSYRAPGTVTEIYEESNGNGICGLVAPPAGAWT